MRFKDFGVVEPTVLRNGLVSVSSTVSSESEQIKRLEFLNKEYLYPWRTSADKDDASSKIFTVRYAGRIAGQIILYNFQSNSGLKSCSISYWIDNELAGRNIGTSSVELVIDYAFSHLGIDEIDALIPPENKPSIRVIEKLKFKHRDMIGEGKVLDGRWQNYTLYTVTREVKNADI